MKRSPRTFTKMHYKSKHISDHLTGIWAVDIPAVSLRLNQHIRSKTFWDFEEISDDTVVGNIENSTDIYFVNNHHDG